MTNRRLARESVVKMLYQARITGDDLRSVCRNYWSVRFPAHEARLYANVLLKAVEERGAEIDELLRGCLENYRLERLGVVELSVLRCSAAELMLGETPPRVIIDEAVEIARDYAGDEAPAFVNGVLDRLARKLESL